MDFTPDSQPTPTLLPEEAEAHKRRWRQQLDLEKHGQILQQQLEQSKMPEQNEPHSQQYACPEPQAQEYPQPSTGLINQPFVNGDYLEVGEHLVLRLRFMKTNFGPRVVACLQGKNCILPERYNTLFDAVNLQDYDDKQVLLTYNGKAPGKYGGLMIALVGIPNVMKM